MKIGKGRWSNWQNSARRGVGDKVHTNGEVIPVLNSYPLLCFRRSLQNTKLYTTSEHYTVQLTTNEGGMQKFEEYKASIRRKWRQHCSNCVLVGVILESGQSFTECQVNASSEDKTCLQKCVVLHFLTKAIKEFNDSQLTHPFERFKTVSCKGKKTIFLLQKYFQEQSRGWLRSSEQVRRICAIITHTCNQLPFLDADLWSPTDFLDPSDSSVSPEVQRFLKNNAESEYRQSRNRRKNSRPEFNILKQC